MPAPVCVLGCSPRAHGNTDIMAARFAEGVAAAGYTAQIQYLRQTPLAPCSACGGCRLQGRCVLPDTPELEAIIAHLCRAPLVFLTIPVFFYHVPAQCKALLDRSQYLWEKHVAAGHPSDANAAVQPRPAIVGMVAGRAHGDKLFDGALLSLRYFFSLCGLRLHDTLLLRGYDHATALRDDADACARCVALARTHAEQLAYPLPPSTTAQA